MNNNICIYPWINFHIHSDSFGCCCRSDLQSKTAFQMLDKSFQYKEGSLMELWNSEYYQEARSKMSTLGYKDACGFNKNYDNN